LAIGMEAPTGGVEPPAKKKGLKDVAFREKRHVPHPDEKEVFNGGESEGKRFRWGPPGGEKPPIRGVTCFRDGGKS